MIGRGAGLPGALPPTCIQIQQFNVPLFVAFIGRL
jgi:hypothetical protein